MGRQGARYYPHFISLFSFFISGLGLLLISSFFFPGCQSSSQVEVSLSRQVIRTYPFSDPDPVPIMVRSGLWGRGARLYPYFFIEKMSLKPEEREWTVVRLENPFLTVEVLPEVGGKVWGALDKGTGRYFIYKNHVLKFREVALRGPWTSGGIEFNFGIVGHSPSTASPVDYLVRRETDGSLACYVGTWDWPSRTRWSVAVVLPPDKSYFETRCLWINYTPYFQSYYVWLNAAVRAGDDLQFIMPGQYHLGHNYAVPLRPWPIDEQGRDLSWYKNNNFGSSKSYFTVGEYRHFFGGYWHQSKQGFGHWARYTDVPGHKTWIWSLARDGGIWENLLTDSDGQYCEPQAGRLLNQSDHEHFFPLATERWSQFWFPYHQIGPMKAASPYAVLSTTRQGEHQLLVEIFPLQDFAAPLIIKNKKKVLYQENISLKTAQPWRKQITFQEKTDEYQIDLGNKLHYIASPGAYQFKKPLNFQNYDRRTLQRHFLKALRLEKGRNLNEALQEYENILKKAPDYLPALTRAAELYLRRGEKAKAWPLAQAAVKINMYDPAANYIYALVARGMDYLTDAKEALTWAARDGAFCGAAYSQLAEIFLTEGQLDEALEFIQRAVEKDPKNIPSLQLLALLQRKKGWGAKAAANLTRLENIDPLNPFIQLERYWPQPSPARWSKIKKFIKNEFPEETILEMALYYHRLHQEEECLHLLRKIEHYPLAAYWLAFLLKEKNRAESRFYLETAQSSSPYLIFPFREESIPVLQWAIGQAPLDWKAKYYLALLFWSKGRGEEAEKLLIACGNAPDFPPFYIVRGTFLKNKNKSQAEQDFRLAVKIGEKTWRPWHHLIQFYLDTGRFSQALKIADQAGPLFPEEKSIQADWVEALIQNGRFQPAADILDKTTFLPSEGATKIHRLFVKCHLFLGLEKMKKGYFRQAIRHFQRAKTYPEHLGTGQPYEPDWRLQDLLLGLAYQKLGEKELAQRHFQKVKDYTLKHWREKRPFHALAALYLLRKEKMIKAGELLKKFPLTSQDKPFSQFLLKELR
ncbi:MAG: hypothetical protein DRJ11_02550 [Candidatus Aminicenantes bacterium]|nr:MAG: hypothetical protein DRJ11_02550 [Candidatus Aminicenantes bacterium]